MNILLLIYKYIFMYMYFFIYKVKYYVNSMLSPISCLTKFNKKLYQLKYKFRDKEYIVLVKICKGPKKILMIKDEYDNDVTEVVKQYLGPNEDFHGNPCTPKKINFQILHFFTIDDKKFSYKGNDIINFKE